METNMLIKMGLLLALRSTEPLMVYINLGRNSPVSFIIFSSSVRKVRGGGRPAAEDIAAFC